MPIPLMNASRPPYAKSGQSMSAKKGDPYLFWWIIVIFVLIALTTFTWMSSLYVFQHPEKPKNYRLLARIGKLEPLVRFKETAVKDRKDKQVPKAQFYTAKEVYAKFFNWTDKELAAQNDILKRNYIQNYTNDVPIYLKGEYRIYKVAELSGKTPFPEGLVVRARSTELPNVSIEFLFPTEGPPLARPQAGDDLLLKTNNTFASALHISRLAEESLCFTVVPLSYNSFPVDAQGKQFIKLAPPALLNMNAPWPVTDDTVDAVSAPVPPVPEETPEPDLPPVGGTPRIDPQ